MMDSKDLNDFIVENGIEAEIVFLPTKTPTVEAAADAVGVHPEQIGKSLLFMADGKPVLVIANGTSRVAYKRLAQQLGISRKQLRMANASQVLAITGYPVGTVPPFGHKEPVAVLMDKAVMDQSELYVGGGTENALVRIETLELLRATGATIVQL